MRLVLPLLLVVFASCATALQLHHCPPIARPCRRAPPLRASDASADADAAFLRMQLKYAVKREDYEEASRLRALLSLEERVSDASDPKDEGGAAPQQGGNVLKRAWRRVRTWFRK